MAPSSSVLSYRTTLTLFLGFVGTWWLLSHGSSFGGWQFEYPRDSANYGLSSQQCDAAFPGFYGDIESAVLSRKGNPIRPDELEIEDDKCLVRALIYESELFIVQGRTNKKCWMARWHERTSGFLHMIHQSVITAPPGSVPNIEFVLDLDDDPQRPLNFAHGKDSNKTTVWGLTRLAHQRHIWLLPDYAYWAWPTARVPSHGQVRRNVRQVNAAFPWEKKFNKAIWRGDAGLNQGVRNKLIATAKDTTWGDVRVCDIYNPETKQYCMTQDQLCRYKFPVHTEGYTYSGRLKYLQLCNSAPVVHKLKWLEHHHGAMVSSGPQQNYIEVEADWSDLDEKVNVNLLPVVFSNRTDIQLFR
ncbi:hypothetical protein KCU70_g51, partial [Aureobasidium melanogenum]